MILGYIKNYTHTFTKQMQKLVGTLIGKEVSLVNLQNINITNIMIGTAIVGINHMIEKIQTIQSTAEFENYL